MTKRVALFFDDAELGSHLRAALSEHGAEIAHEGPLTSFNEAGLRGAKVNVLVVNLDDTADDAALDRIYELVGSGDIPVVFNDAQASRNLDGWDRARWARHLAAKTLDTDNIDPPRPEDARALNTPVEPVAGAVIATAAASEVVDDVRRELSAEQSDSSETLAAELEALLASDETQHAEESPFGSGLKFREDEELPPLHDGDFGVIEHEPVSAQAEADPARNGAEEVVTATLESPAFNIDLNHLSLASLDDEVASPALEKSSLAQQTSAPVAPEWGFVEDEATPLASGSVSSPDKPFSVEKMSAADFLAPDVAHLEDHESPVEPGMSLELVSIEEAIAPKEEFTPYETHLYELDTALNRLLVLGAAHDSRESVASFLAALPEDLKLPVLLTQHQGEHPLEYLIATFSAQCSLPVKAAAHGMRVQAGEIVVVPRGHQARLVRDGRLELTVSNEDAAGQSPSIDHSFTMAANVFGRDALAIVFAGQGTDAVAGAQAIHDRGGQVWVESSGDHGDMVNGVMAERLASFSGSPHELAVRLVEDFR